MVRRETSMSAETGAEESELSREIINICNSTKRMLELAVTGHAGNDETSHEFVTLRRRL